MFQDSSSLMKINMVPTHIQFLGGHPLIDLAMHAKRQLDRSNSYWHIPQIRTVFQKYKKNMLVYFQYFLCEQWLMKALQDTYNWSSGEGGEVLLPPLTLLKLCKFVEFAY